MEKPFYDGSGEAGSGHRAAVIAERAGLEGNMAKFADLERSYEIEASQSLGEKALAALSAIVDREYSWSFSKNDQLWRFEPSNSHTIIDYEGSTYIASLEIPANQHYAETEADYFYHIHPVKELSEFATRTGKDVNLLRLLHQIPSTNDIQAEISLYNGGYKAAKIVTPYGVTTITFHPEKAKSQVLKGMNIESDRLKEVLARSGFEKTIQLIIEEMNKHYKGAFKFTYSPFDQ